MRTVYFFGYLSIILTTYCAAGADPSGTEGEDKIIYRANGGINGAEVVAPENARTSQDCGWIENDFIPSTGVTNMSFGVEGGRILLQNACKVHHETNVYQASNIYTEAVLRQHKTENCLYFRYGAWTGRDKYRVQVVKRPCGNYSTVIGQDLLSRGAPEGSSAGFCDNERIMRSGDTELEQYHEFVSGVIDIPECWILDSDDRLRQ